MFGIDPALLSLKLPHAYAAPHVGEEVAQEQEVKNQSVYIHQLFYLQIVELCDRHDLKNCLVNVLLILTQSLYLHEPDNDQIPFIPKPGVGGQNVKQEVTFQILPHDFIGVIDQLEIDLESHEQIAVNVEGVDADNDVVNGHPIGHEVLIIGLEFFMLE